MAIYTVFAPPARDDETTSFDSDPLGFVFVKERFCWPALFFGGLWLIYRRQWLVLIGYIVVSLVISAVGTRIGGPFPGVLIVALHVLFALEANELRRWTLGRNGYRLIGIAEGRNVEEAEIRFFTEREAHDAGAPPAPPARPAAPPPAPRKPYDPGPQTPSVEAGDVVGLFPAPGGSAR